MTHPYMKLLSATLLLVSLQFAAPAADDWPPWRGPNPADPDETPPVLIP